MLPSGQCTHTVALNAPITPGRFAELLPDLDAVADGIERYFRRARRRISREGVAISKHTGGGIADNAYGRPDAAGKRKSVLEKGKIPVEKDLDDRFFLVIKQPGLFTAMLPQLAERMTCYALVRNPLCPGLPRQPRTFGGYFKAGADICRAALRWSATRQDGQRGTRQSGLETGDDVLGLRALRERAT